MTDWIYVNTQKITKIGYNQEIKTLYIDFAGSSFDTPYKNISLETFEEFSRADRVDDYYEESIKNKFQPTLLNTDCTIVFEQDLKQ